jgi:YidC/Oxa1 family membrane protein insertase
MNFKTIIAFALILATLFFFRSDFYYHNIRHQPTPAEIAKQKKTVPQAQGKETKPEKLAPDTTAAIDSSASSDTTQSQPASISHDTVRVETEKLRIAIDQQGGKIISIKTKDYQYDKKGGKDKDIELIDVANNGGANLKINDKSFDEALFSLADTVKDYRLGKNDTANITFFVNDPEMGRIEKKFSFDGSSYDFGLKIVSPTLEGKKVSVGWESGIAESEKGGTNYSGIIRSIHLMYDKNVEHLNDKKAGVVTDRAGFYKWIGLTSKYFLISVIADSVRDAEIRIESFSDKQAEAEGKKGKNQAINYQFFMQRSAIADVDSYKIYAGPNKVSDLKDLGVGLDKVMYRGYRWFFFADQWFPTICVWLLQLLIWLQKWVHDYGVVIIILTILLRIVTYPLTMSSMKSMSRMKDVQPKMEAIRAKYKNNPKKMNEQIMALYKKEGINPFNPGCLPMILQMPIFIALFVVLNKAIELRGAQTFLLPWVGDLSQAEALFHLPFAIPFYGSNVALLPIIMAVLTFFQNKATIKDPNQKMMIYFMPIMMLVLFNNFPAGLVLYWTFSSALQLVQQFMIDYSKKRSAKAA